MTTDDEHQLDEPDEPGEKIEPVDPELTAISYAAAIDELDKLLADLEQDDADIDELATNVARAAVLIRVCRVRLDQARVDVERIVAELEPT